MEVRTRGDYELAEREVVAEGADLRVQVLDACRGPCIPWRDHRRLCLSRRSNSGRDSRAAE